MKKKIASILLVLGMVASFAACSKSEESTRATRETKETTEETTEDTEKETTEESTTEETTTEETTTESTTEETTTESTTEETTTEATTEESKDESKETEESKDESKETEESKEESKGTEESKDRSGYSDKWVDFDNMFFTVDGKKFELGKSTLQDMIDANVPFAKKYESIYDEIMKKNQYSLMGMTFDLAKFHSASVKIMNLTDSEQKYRDCIIKSISLPSIDKIAEDEVKVEFGFPLDMTPDELLANAPKPDKDEVPDGSSTRTIEYKQKAKKFLGASYYTFKFKDGKLDSVSIDYLP